MEISATYVRLYNLFERCRKCKEKRCFVDILATARKLRNVKPEELREMVQLLKQNSKCRLTLDDFKFLMYADFLQLFEENFEPDPRYKDFFEQDVTWETNEQGQVMKITLTSLV